MKVRNITGRQVLVDDQFLRPSLDFMEVKPTRAIKALVEAGVLEAAPEDDNKTTTRKSESKEVSK